MGYSMIKDLGVIEIGSSIEVEVPDSSLILIDAGRGGSCYAYLKRYSAILEVAKTESENFKVTVAFVSRNKIKITPNGAASTSARCKIIKLA